MAMKRKVIGATGAVLAATVSLGLMSAPAQAMTTLPGLKSFGVIESAWKEVSSVDLPGLAGGVQGLCVVADSCATRLWIPASGEFTGLNLVSAARTGSKANAKQRLADIRVGDKAKFAANETPVSVTWTKVKFNKKQKKANKGVTAWFSVVTGGGDTMKIGMAVKDKRIAYFAGVPDYYATEAQFVAPLVRVVKAKSKLPLATGATKGLYGALSKLTKGE